MRPMFTIFLVLTAATMAIGQPRLHVASWNISDDDVRSALKSQQMADHLRLLNVDILLLNHIDGNSDRRSARLDSIFAHGDSNDGQTWEYTLFANRTVSDRSSLTGVAWNTERVTRSKEVFRAVSDSETLWSKPPYAAQFSAGPGLTDIVVMPVQLEPKNPEAACYSGARGEEAENLPARIEMVRSQFGDDDIVVIGDTDCLRDDPSAVATLATDDEGLILPVGNVDAFAAGRGTYNQVMVPRSQPEFQFTRVYELTQADGFSSVSHLSDHFLLLAPIKVMRDDD